MKTRISNHIRAGFPILAIESSEETRLLDTIRQVSECLKRRSIVFSITRGSVNMVDLSVDTENDPMAFLGQIEKSDQKTIWIYLDPGSILNDEMFQRKIKDIAPVLRNGNTLILIAPAIKIPENISHLVKSIMAPLPQKEELQKVVNDTTNGMNVTIADNTIDALSGLTTEQAADAIALSLVESKEVNSEVIMREKVHGLKKDYFQIVDKLPTIDDIGGLEELKSWVRKRIKCFGQDAKEFGIKTPKGLLLCGVQGCGKSLAAKATASVLNVPLLRLDFGALMGGVVGESERNTRECIKVAEAMAPVVLWVDELDKQMGGNNPGDGHEVTKRVLSSFLVWMQEKTSSVFVVCTANNIQGLASSYPELLRKGRFDEIFFVDLPNATEREQIFRIHIAKTKKEFGNIEPVVLATDGFSGAEIENVVDNTMVSVFEHEYESNPKETSFGMEYLVEAAKQIVPQSKMARNVIDGLREWIVGKARYASTKEEKTQNRKIEL